MGQVQSIKKFENLYAEHLQVSSFSKICSKKRNLTGEAHFWILDQSKAQLSIDLLFSFLSRWEQSKVLSFEEKKRTSLILRFALRRVLLAQYLGCNVKSVDVNQATFLKKKPIGLKVRFSEVVKESLIIFSFSEFSKTSLRVFSVEELENVDFSDENHWVSLSNHWVCSYSKTDEKLKERWFCLKGEE